MQESNFFDFKAFITNWDLQYPYDRFWRLKYNVPFGSEQHKKMNFIDMVLDLMEDKIIKNLSFANDDLSLVEDANFFNEHLPPDVLGGENQANKEVIKMTPEQVEEDFKNLDLSQFNE